MVTVAELRLPAARFAFAATFETHPDAEIEFGRAAAHRATGSSSLLWVRADDLPSVEDSLHAEDCIDSIDRLADFGNRWLYCVDWGAPVAVVLDVLLQEGTLLNAFGGAGEWTFEVLFPSRDALSAAYQLSSDRELGVDVDHIRHLDGDDTRRYGLTDKQHRALVAAQDHGYFEVPRRVSLEEVADDIGVSRQALSERLRRGHNVLISNVLQTANGAGAVGESE